MATPGAMWPRRSAAAAAAIQTSVPAALALLASHTMHAARTAHAALPEPPVIDVRLDRTRALQKWEGRSSEGMQRRIRVT